MVVAIIVAILVFLMLGGLIFVLCLMVFLETYDDIVRVIDDIKERRKNKKLTEFQKNSEKV